MSGPYNPNCHEGHTKWTSGCSGCANASVRRHAPKRDHAVREAAKLLGLGFREFCRTHGRSIIAAEYAVANHQRNQRS